MMLASLGLLLLYSTVIRCKVESFPNKCAAKAKGESTDLPNIKLLSSYMVSSVYTNWMTNVTMTIDEVRHDNSYVIDTTTRNGTVRWSTLGSQLLHIVNHTDCCVANESVMFSLPNEFTDTIPLNVSSIYDIVNSIVEKKISGFINNTRVVSGVEGVGWVGCLNVTGSSSLIAVEVVYGGLNSLDPPSSTFDNPVILSLAIAYYTDASDENSTMTQRISLDFSPFRQVEVDDLDHHFEITHGVVCSGLAQEPNISVLFPKDFDVIYSKLDSNSEMTSKMIYDSEGAMIGESVIDGRAHLLNESLLKGDYFVVHDIPRRAEFVFSSSPSCSVRSIPEGTNDIQSPIDLFFPVSFQSLNFSLYSNTSLLNMPVLEYRANYSSSTGNKVIEAVFHRSILSSVSIYSEKALQSISKIAVKEKNMNYGDSVHLAYLLRGCFTSSSSNVLSFVLDEVSTGMVLKWREDVVSNKIANILVEQSNVTICPYRLSFSYFGDGGEDIKHNNTRVIVKVGERMAGSTEMTASQFVEHLIKIPTGLSFHISKEEIWKTSGPLIPYPPPPPAVPPSFNGYTSGSMLVMAIFMVMFGVAVGAGGVYIVLRRQRISTLAYQVFE